ncbi:unnamed protein product [Effrenium voratum]|nr:unnamed protein product [Effrenium voratum]
MLDKDKFDQSVDGWVDLGLPAPFHMRPLKGMNESTNFGIQSSLMGDVVTISLNTVTLQLAGSNSLKPVATRHLKKYLISGASEYVKDAGQQGMGTSRFPWRSPSFSVRRPAKSGELLMQVLASTCFMPPFVV